jgi:hypothetical protein
MRVRNAIIVVHVVALLVAYSLFVSTYFFPSMRDSVIVVVISLTGLIATITGFIALAWKIREKESITLAISTILSFVACLGVLAVL